MSEQTHLPPGVYLPKRAWLATPTEIVLLGQVEERFFTYSFTPDELLNHAEAGRNLLRDPGMTQASLSFWPRDLLRELLRIIRRRGVKPWPAQDFRLQSDGQGISVSGKIRFLQS